MRYDRENKTIEISAGELCPRTEGFFDGDAGDLTVSYDAKGSIARRKTECRFVFEGTAFSASGYVLLKSDDTLREFSVRGQRKAPADHTLICAYIYCLENGLSEIAIETVSADFGKSSLEFRVRKKSVFKLEEKFRASLKLLKPFADMIKIRSETILKDCINVKFPYPSLREGQELMMRECYRSMSANGRLFIQAPTGIGKTVSALYPAIKFLGAGKCDKIFYLTAKGSTQNEAYKTAADLFRTGARLRTIVITAKERICPSRQFMKGGVCGRLCPLYNRRATNMRNAVNEILSTRSGYDRRGISEIAAKYGVCPYELSLSVSEFCEIIIADYNYVFDPSVCIRRLFDDRRGGERYVFLIDEAHNLVPRAREMYSAELRAETFTALKNTIPQAENAVDEVLEEIGVLLGYCSDSVTKGDDGVDYGYYLSHSRYERMDHKLKHLYDILSKYIKVCGDAPFYEDVITACGQIKKYILSAEYFEGSSVFYCESVSGSLKFKSFCIDPSRILDGKMKTANSVILFSATLTPSDYFTDILGGGGRAAYVAIKSPFDESNLFLGCVTNVSARYEDRKKTASAVLNYIAASFSAKKGNYMVYFPSYEYMRMIAEMFKKKFPEIPLLVQRKDMSADAREEYLGLFRLDDEKMRIGFCVLGGSFSEGIDLSGSSLIGAVIVGTGIPGISGENNIMRDYFDYTRECGFDYAYTYPGMNNVLQAAGRVIRGDGDRGIVILIDDRYATEKYRAMYPEHWSRMQFFGSPLALNEKISEFWAKKNEKMNN